jgi:hypothetical protein
MGPFSGSVLLCLHLAERQKLQRCNSLRCWNIAYDQSVLCSWDLYQTGGSTGSAVVLFRHLGAMPWAAVLFVGIIGTGELHGPCASEVTLTRALFRKLGRYAVGSCSWKVLRQVGDFVFPHFPSAMVTYNSFFPKIAQGLLSGGPTREERTRFFK